MARPAIFDHEKLDVYQLELKFLTWVTYFLADLSHLSAAQTRELRGQLDRASLSGLLNTVEGNGRRQGRQQARFFDDARFGDRMCGLPGRGHHQSFTTLGVVQPGKEMLLRIVAMLSELVERFDPEQYRVRENASGVTESFEDEHEHEDEMRSLLKRRHSEE